MHKKFKINRPKIKGGCQLERKVVTYDSKSDLPLVDNHFLPDQMAVYQFTLIIYFGCCVGITTFSAQVFKNNKWPHSNPLTKLPWKSEVLHHLENAIFQKKLTPVFVMPT